VMERLRQQHRRRRRYADLMIAAMYHHRPENGPISPVKT
jgi:hypothetical protein